MAPVGALPSGTLRLNSDIAIKSGLPQKPNKQFMCDGLLAPYTKDLAQKFWDTAMKCPSLVEGGPCKRTSSHEEC